MERGYTCGQAVASGLPGCSEREAHMFESLVQASEAMRLGAGAAAGSITPALCGCIQCGTRRLIAAPVLGSCEDCGQDLQVLTAT
jgi:hypothetical protein